jgi:hypothetical protein
MADLLPLLVPAGAGTLAWWLASLAAPRGAANDNGPCSVTLPHPNPLAEPLMGS